mmetsp:Transcript_21934/g.68243  ORF Transcript_21934/g.68243 Transcript_21934/m.68243 type:complete len:242 (+) Transcript_21934:60-785(+)
MCRGCRRRGPDSRPWRGLERGIPHLSPSPACGGGDLSRRRGDCDRGGAYSKRGDCAGARSARGLLGGRPPRGRPDAAAEILPDDLRMPHAPRIQGPHRGQRFGRPAWQVQVLRESVHTRRRGRGRGAHRQQRRHAHHHGGSNRWARSESTRGPRHQRDRRPASSPRGAVRPPQRYDHPACTRPRRRDCVGGALGPLGLGTGPPPLHAATSPRSALRPLRVPRRASRPPHPEGEHEARLPAS